MRLVKLTHETANYGLAQNAKLIIITIKSCGDFQLGGCPSVPLEPFKDCLSTCADVRQAQVEK